MLRIVFSFNVVQPDILDCASLLPKVADGRLAVWSHAEGTHGMISAWKFWGFSALLFKGSGVSIFCTIPRREKRGAKCCVSFSHTTVYPGPYLHETTSRSVILAGFYQFEAYLNPTHNTVASL